MSRVNDERVRRKWGYTQRGRGIKDTERKGGRGVVGWKGRLDKVQVNKQESGLY